uniref:Putative capsid protein n=1 Tax=viral metagenome TaxID=1070528 RepID=A0A6H1ZEW6_9ZZZZ
MATVTVTSALDFVPEIWSLEVLDSYENTHVYPSLFDQGYTELKDIGYGDIINVPDIPSMSAGTVTQGSAVTFTQPSHSTVQITVSTWKAAAFEFPNLVRVQAMPSLRKGYTEKLGLALKEAIDDDCAGLMDDFSNTVGTDAVTLTDANVRRIRQYADDNNWPTEGRVLVVSPAQLMDFYDVEKFTNSLYRGTSLAAEKSRGYIGPLYGFDVHESSNLDATSSGHDMGAFHKRACALVISDGPRLEQWRNVTKLQDEVIVHATWGVKRMRNADGGVYVLGL